MNKESLAINESEATAAPTQLRLFKMTNGERVRMEGMYGESVQLRNILESNRKNYGSILDQGLSSLKNVEEVETEQKEIGYQYLSFRTASAAYLIMSEELVSQGYDEQEILKIFKFSFQNNVLDRQILWTHEERSMAHAQGLIKDKKHKNHTEKSPKIFDVAPEWFSGTNNEWKKLMLRYSSFPTLFNEGILKRFYSLTELGYVSDEFIPDWMEDVEEVMPTRERVVQELEEDTKEHEAVIEYLEKLNERSVAYASYFLDRLDKTYRKSSAYKEKFITHSNGGLADFVLYLKASENEEAAEGESLKVDDYSVARTYSAEYTRQLAIYDFATEKPLSKEMVAVWLERKFRGAGIEASRTMDAELIRRLGLFTEDKVDSLRELNTKDRKLFKVLNYEFKPLLLDLPQEQQEYLTELLNFSEGQEFGEFILEAADLIAGRINTLEDNSFTKMELEVRKITLNWLSNKWEWAYENLVTEIRGTETLTESNSQEEVFVEEEFIQQDVKNNLFGWKISYATDKRVNDGELLDIICDGLDSVETSLEQVLLREGQQVSIKNSSLINALNWIVTIPDDILVRWPEKKVNGEDFKKFKRGAVRILAKVDKDKKELAFFLHQKKAWTYGF